MAVRIEDVFAVEPISGPVSQDDLLAYLQRQFHAIQAGMQLGFAQNIAFLDVAPEKPREGLVVGADGTNWDPGGGIGGPATSGQGVYCYYADAWHKLG